MNKQDPTFDAGLLEGAVSRRTFIAGAAGVALTAALPAGRLSAQTVSFDYYISPSGNDSNPGTQSQPWAITAINSHRTAYAGKKVGLLPGTYNVSTLPATDAAVLLQVAPGTSSSPTVIQSVTPQAAIITAKSGSSYTSNGTIIGSGANGTGVRNPFIQYITLKGLVITGSASGCVSFDADGYVGACPGIVIDSCIIHDMVNPSGAANKGGISFGTALVGAVVHNCLIYDCYQAGVALNQHANSAAIYDWAISTIIEYCTIYDCTSAVYQKNQSAGPPQGEIFRYNYVYATARGMDCVFDGFNNATGTSPPYKSTQVYGNIFEIASPLHYNSNNGADGFQANWLFYNNTVWGNGTGNNAVWGTMVETPAAIATGCKISIYNNITARPAGKWNGDRGDVAVAQASWAVWDYNCWPADGKVTYTTGDTPYPTAGLMAFAQWQSQPRTPDVHGVTGVPTFASTIVPAAGTAQYKLAGNSIGKGAGRIGGVSSGAAVDMGAWGAGSSQIGCDFKAAAIPIPMAPTSVSVS